MHALNVAMAQAHAADLHRAAERNRRTAVSVRTSSGRRSRRMPTGSRRFRWLPAGAREGAR
jgi:hypothetical protein